MANIPYSMFMLFPNRALHSFTLDNRQEPSVRVIPDCAFKKSVEHYTCGLNRVQAGQTLAYPGKITNHILVNSKFKGTKSMVVVKIINIE